MGCGPSQSEPPKDDKKSKKKNKHKSKEKEPKEKAVAPTANNSKGDNPLKSDGYKDTGTPTNNQQQQNAQFNNTNNTTTIQQQTAKSGGGGSQTMLGRDKYIADVGAVGMTTDHGGYLVCYVPDTNQGLAFSFRDNTGHVYVRQFVSDADLIQEKADCALDFPWSSIYKSVASDIMKGKAKITSSMGTVSVTITVVGKDSSRSQNWVMKLASVGSGHVELFNHLLVPMSRMAQKKRTVTGDHAVKETRFIELECGLHSAQANAHAARSRIQLQKPKLTVSQNDAAELQRREATIAAKISQLNIHKQQRDLALQAVNPQRQSGKLSKLDDMYEKGGPQEFPYHIVWAGQHVPTPTPITSATVGLTSALFPLSDQTLGDRIKNAPSNPLILKLNQQFPDERHMVDGLLMAFQKIDDWDFDVFQVDKATRGNSLQVVTYALLLKLDLINHFNLDDVVVRRFLAALQSGYHPNPYHNATHAADVTQINYFIICKAGLAEKCGLSKTELLGAILSGAIHDYDHPGFNNNFHTKVNSYLSTLYNDRSVLENHHCSSIFEMLRHPAYNFLAPMSAKDRQAVRDVILEMVLATDMGNHARIFSTFQRRLQEIGNGAWHSTESHVEMISNPTTGIRKEVTVTERTKESTEDVKLALAIAIKMADISNCGRPHPLYMEWAKNIAREFYNQGDAELCSPDIPLSPFMDRKKYGEEFPKGQMSFMSFIVAPMFEAIRTLLPKMDFTVQLCNENHAYWKLRTELLL